LTVLVAAVQMRSGDDEEANFARVRRLAMRAADRGARFIVFPENVLYEGKDASRRHPLSEWEPRFAELAAALGCSVSAGTLREPAGEDRAHNTLLVLGPSGERLGLYRKIHLFDVDVPGGPTETESAYIQPGAPDAVVIDVPEVGKVGLSICYDLRFPELYRALTQEGARTIIIPSSFALGTGKDHWLTLLRARAIENQTFVIAPDQFGRKPHGRTKFGKTAIVDPWGQVLGCAREVDEDVVVCELDFAHQDRIRASLPCLEHRRL
jgi:deaminated glutathione amidase